MREFNTGRGTHAFRGVIVSRMLSIRCDGAPTEPGEVVCRCACALNKLPCGGRHAFLGVSRLAELEVLVNLLCLCEHGCGKNRIRCAGESVASCEFAGLHYVRWQRGKVLVVVN